MKNNYGKIDKYIKIEFLKDPRPEVAKNERLKLVKEIKELKEILNDLEGYEQYLNKSASSGRCINSKALIWELTKQGRCKKVKLRCFEKNFKPSRRNGLIIEDYCNCGNYSSKSIRGLIDTDCENCGKKKNTQDISKLSVKTLKN